MGCGASCGAGRAAAAAAATYVVPPPAEEWPPTDVKRKLEKMVARLTGDMIRATFVSWADDMKTEKARREDGRLRIFRKFQQCGLSHAYDGWHHRAVEQAKLKRVASKATKMMLAGKLAGAFNKWEEYVSQVVGARRILARIFKGQLFNCWEAWQEHHYECQEDKREAAAKIQALRRGQIKRRGLQEQKLAATKMQALMRGKQARTAATGIAARMKAVQAGLDRPKPSALNSLLEDIVGATADVIDVKPSLQVATGNSTQSRLSTAALARLAKALLPHAPLTDAELEMLGVGSSASRKALLRSVGATAVASKESKARRKEAKVTTGWLSASVKSARGLKKMDMDIFNKGGADPYVVVRVGSTTQKTEIIKGSREPTWDAAIRFEEVDPNSGVIVRVYDWDRVGSDEAMGQVVFQMDDIEEGNYQFPAWHTLKPMEGCDEPTGEIMIGITAEFPEPEEESEEEAPEKSNLPRGVKPKVVISWGARLRGVGDVGAQQRRQRELLGAASAVAAAGHISISHAAAESYEAMLHSGYDLEREAGHGGSMPTGATSFHAGGRHGAEVYGAVKSIAIRKAAAQQNANASNDSGAGRERSSRRSPQRRSPQRRSAQQRSPPREKDPYLRSPPRDRRRQQQVNGGGGGRRR